MFEPVSSIAYHVTGPDRQILVCTLDTKATPKLLAKWEGRACAFFEFNATADLCDVVRDLLANPQIRAIVFDGVGTGRDAFTAFWHRQVKPTWSLNEDHLELVRQFVDLFDEDCRFHKPQQPFWPERLRYMSKES